ncbi:Crp/Fnr family transcriptional regulator [Paracoccus zhejiangensis]|uniref:Crp/Fnr family transcriptional regulator n=1 Tax=Paracoccus zhejiangensis TaxID=1077935 RepID=UPI0012FFDFBC|nr:Crp/Fnr family transcriptional regulator [Paracoccus zhejiangensis]
MRNSTAFPNLLRANILANLPDETRTSFIDQCLVRSHSSPVEILTQGVPAAGLFLVAHGRVEVSHCDEDGNSSLIYIAGAGEVLGEVEALTDNPCAASCTTLPNTTLLFCPTAQIIERIGSVQFFRNILSTMYERLMRDNRLLIINQFYTLDQRLCIYLGQLSSPKRPDVEISQAQLAGMIGCSRQAINRKLAKLQDEGLIGLGKGKIRVLDREGLERMGDVVR